MLDKLFKEENKRYKKINAPDNMEEILNEGLNKIPSKNKNKKIFLKVASILVIFTLIIGINSNTIAYNINNIGSGAEVVESYKELVTENIKNIENSNYMQKINKEIVFSNGSKIIVDGILVDKLGATILYREYSDRKGSYISLDLRVGNTDERFNYSAEGEDKEDYTKWKCYMAGEIDEPNIRLIFRDNSINEELEMKIKLNSELFIKEFKELRINEKIRYKGNKYKIESIKATPIKLKIEGSYENIFELIYRSIFKIRGPENHIDIKLLFDGKVYNYSISERKTDLGGSYFSFEYEDFPTDIENMSLEIVDGKTGDIIEVIELNK